MREYSPPTTCHMSHVMCQMSCVTCQMSFFSLLSYKVVEQVGRRWRVCYQQGLSRLVLYTYLVFCVHMHNLLFTCMHCFLNTICMVVDVFLHSSDCNRLFLTYFVVVRLLTLTAVSAETFLLVLAHWRL